MQKGMQNAEIEPILDPIENLTIRFSADALFNEAEPALNVILELFHGTAGTDKEANKFDNNMMI